MCIWNCDLLLDAFVFVKHLECVSCKLAGSIMSYKLDLLPKLRLDLEYECLDRIFTVRLSS
ncbi:hypothetical protein Plhal304r1_c104g0175561 [Plasmopara halstedii]